MTKLTRRSPGLQTPAEVAQFKKQKTATTTTSKDGATTTKRRDTAKTSRSLTEKKGKLLERSSEYTRSSTRGKTQSEATFTDAADMLGRRSQRETHESVDARGDVTSRLDTHDVFGIDRSQTDRQTVRINGNSTVSSNTSASRDSLGNARSSSDVTTVTVDGKTTTTSNRQQASGSDLQTRSATTYEGGTFRIADGADYSRGSSWGRSTMRETEADASRYTNAFDKASPIFGKIWKALGLEAHGESTVPADQMHTTSLYSSEHGSVQTNLGISGGQSYDVDGDGIRGSFSRQATAGIRADYSNSVEGEYGRASIDAHASAEATAYVDANGSITANGLDAQVRAGVKVSVEAEATARAETNSISIGGVPMNASAELHARAVAEAKAEVTGQATITRDPPTAILQGTAGASAVVRADADITLSAGPFSFTGDAYVSAGAEATASGIIGYQDGHLKIGGSLGAALGVGAGVGGTLDINVGQIADAAKGLADLDGDGQLGFGDLVAGAEGLFHLGESALHLGENLGKAATHALDVNGDGKLGLDDATAAARSTLNLARSAVTHAADLNGDGKVGLDDAAVAARRVTSAAAHTVSNVAHTAERVVSTAVRTTERAVSSAVHTAERAVSNATRAAVSTASNVAHAAANVAHSAAKKVAGWFGF